MRVYVKEWCGDCRKDTSHTTPTKSNYVVQSAEFIYLSRMTNRSSQNCAKRRRNRNERKTRNPNRTSRPRY